MRFPPKDYKENIWDHCAGSVIVEAAGGKVSLVCTCIGCIVVLIRSVMDLETNLISQKVENSTSNVESSQHLLNCTPK